MSRLFILWMVLRNRSPQTMYSINPFPPSVHVVYISTYRRITCYCPCNIDDDDSNYKNYAIGKYVSKIRKQAPLIRVADIVLLGVKIERPDAMGTLHVLSLVHLLLLCERCASDGVLTSAAADGSSLDATAAWDTSPTPSASQPPGVTQSSSDLALICPTSLPVPLQVSEADQVRRAKCRTICLSNVSPKLDASVFVISNVGILRVFL